MSITFLACEKAYEVDLSNNHDQIVVNSFISNDSLIKLHLSISGSPFSNDIKNYSVDKAIIKLTDSNGELFDVNYIEDGFYIASERATIEKKYYLSVQLDSLETIEASSIIPKNYSINLLEKKEVINSDGVKNLEISMTLENSVNKYLVIRHIVDKKVLSLAKDTVSYSDTIWIYGEDSIFDTQLPDYSVKKMIFSKLENDLNKIKFYSYDGFIKESNLISGISKFEILSCSEDYYKYQKELQLYNWNSSNISSSIINSVSLYSNIEHGLGIFAGFNKVIVRDTFK